MLRRSVLGAAVGAALMMSASACVAADEVRPGLSRTEVEQLLGQPSRQAVLEGKRLRDLEQLPPDADISRHRLVYFYDQSRLQVWFLEDQVTGVTRNGISVF